MKATRKIIAPLAGAALLVALVVAASFWAFGQIEEAGRGSIRTLSYTVQTR